MLINKLANLLIIYIFAAIFKLQKEMSAVRKEYKRVTTKSVVEMKANGEKISMLTAYDYTFAKLLDSAGIDVLLVGDSASNVMAGHETTLPYYLRPDDLSRFVCNKRGYSCLGSGRFAFWYVSIRS